MEECLNFRVYILNHGIFGFEMSKYNCLTLKLRSAGRCWFDSGRAVDYVNAVDLAPLPCTRLTLTVN